MLVNRDGGANVVHWTDINGLDRRTGCGTGSDETRGVAEGDVDGGGHPDTVTGEPQGG